MNNDDITKKTDGKRFVEIQPSRHGGFDLTFCKNGFQATVVTIDKDMLVWLRDVIIEEIDSE